MFIELTIFKLWFCLILAIGLAHVADAFVSAYVAEHRQLKNVRNLCFLNEADGFLSRWTVNFVVCLVLVDGCLINGKSWKFIQTRKFGVLKTHVTQIWVDVSIKICAQESLCFLYKEQRAIAVAFSGYSGVSGSLS